ncbi:DUF3069 domain-containing protein [Vibrio marisflavi]|uniref:DUF3069 domain-containing protein n=1 Tax=Vibrio marisflavi CECT 7928 TaxID=634439 RepID=A0ABN8E1K9_9VIBR|nr:DUF3069 domain-containing protein [Vibrio marisflavi]CAH0536770.1 hypothetical protein VMF7928_00671 [Vibrio marisflavi CECT 7928]
MSETVNNENNKVDLESVSPELRHLIEFEEVPEEMHLMVASIHEASESVVRGEWDALPNSAQNILDNFEQFHALITISQAFASVNTIGEFDSMDMPSHLDESQQESYKADILDQVLKNCIKDMVKQLKKARRDAILKRDFLETFKK